MASFWTKLQISGTLLSQGKQSLKLRKFETHNVVNLILSSDRRSFWSWGCAKKNESKGNCRPTVCGEQLPERLQPCNPKCASKCLQISKCADKELAKKKLSNCREISEKKTKKSYVGILLGRKDKINNLPDPNSCRHAYQEKIIMRKKDPRLCDPRYKATAGDVLIFTETPKPEVCEPREPQPKPPPSYKLPRAVVTQRFVEQAEKSPHSCAAALEFEASCDERSPKCSEPNPSILPFVELKPPQIRRKVFSCKYGVQYEDVWKPLRRGGSCGASKPNDCNQQRIVNSSEDLKPNENDSTECSSHIRSTMGQSRIEQLKKLTKTSDGCRNCDLFTRSISRKSTPCPRSCKMSTFSHSQDNSL